MCLTHQRLENGTYLAPPDVSVKADHVNRTPKSSSNGAADIAPMDATPTDTITMSYVAAKMPRTPTTRRIRRPPYQLPASPAPARRRSAPPSARRSSCRSRSPRVTRSVSATEPVAAREVVARIGTYPSQGGGAEVARPTCRYDGVTTEARQAHQSPFGRASAAQLRKLAAVLATFAVIAAYEAAATSVSVTFSFGLKLSTAVTAGALATFLELSARNVMRHLDADYAYWRALQDRRRPRTVRAVRTLAAVGVVVATVALVFHQPLLLGLVVIPTALSALMTVADLTGSWRPI